jgi:hypothetical protein
MKNLQNLFLEQKSHRKTPPLLVKLKHVYSVTQIMETLNLLNGVTQKIIKPNNEKLKLLLSGDI